MASGKRTRFAPSPTGYLHLGNARTALFNYLFASAHDGAFVLRSEDTDVERSDDALLAAMFEDLRWLGIDWSEGPDRDGPLGPYRQSERVAIYARHYERLETLDRVYPCFCTQAELAIARRAQQAAGQAPRYAGTCRRLDAAVRNARLARGDPATLRFAVDAERAPKRILAAHLPNQLANLFRHRCASGLAVTNLPGPAQLDALAVPADDGFRLHDNEEVGPPWPKTAQRSPEQPIKGVQRWARPLALQYGELLAQGEHLERGIPTTAQEDPDRGQEGEDEFEHDSTFVT